MNIVVASSRGKNLSKHLPDDVTVRVKFGGTLNDLKDEAIKITAPSCGIGSRYHIYFLGGEGGA